MARDLDYGTGEITGDFKEEVAGELRQFPGVVEYGREAPAPRQSHIPGAFPKKQDALATLKGQVETTLNHLLNEGLRLKKLGIGGEVEERFEADDGVLYDLNCKITITVQQSK